MIFPQSSCNNVQQFEQNLARIHARMTDETVQSLDEDIKAIKAARPSYDTYMRLTKTEIPALQKELEQHQKSRDALADLYRQVRGKSCNCGSSVLMKP
jgi:DNA repair protein RAD50